MKTIDCLEIFEVRFSRHKAHVQPYRIKNGELIAQPLQVCDVACNGVKKAKVRK